MDGPDWGDGDYARTAATLAPAADVVLDAVGAGPGARILDVACGTGNVAAAAGPRGARVVGVDAAAALLARARERAPQAEFLLGEAGALPVADGSFDAAVSVFGVIFAPDPAAAAAELARAVRPGGRVALTSWVPEGAIATAGRLLMTALPRGDVGADPPRWGDRAWAVDLLAGAGLRDVTVAEHALPFTAASPRAWFAEYEEHHPVWRWARRRLDDAAWAQLRDATVDALGAANEDPEAFRATSRYLLLAART